MLVIESAAAKSAKICRKGLSKRQRELEKAFLMSLPHSYDNMI
ncbi:hypothetical protein QNN00_25240 [Bacillus velezensis]|nr:hypothetical protein [Bacillus velezensis]